MFEETLEMEIPEDILEFDVVVRMLPMKEWSAWSKGEKYRKSSTTHCRTGWVLKMKEYPWKVKI